MYDEHPDYYVDSYTQTCDSCERKDAALEEIQEQVQALFYQLYVTNIYDAQQIARIFFNLQDHIDVQGKYIDCDKYIYNLNFDNRMIS